MNERLIRLYEEIESGKTALGVGPMSKNCIDAAVDLANEFKVPLILIASRRQVECVELGSGYVCSTEDLAKHVRERDKGNYVLLARDHGGPWQGTNELELSHEEAMERAKISYKADIEAGFDIIHLDPSLKTRPLVEIMEDVSNLYYFCESLGRDDIVYEAGTEEHGGHITDPSSFEIFVKNIKEDCPKIKFVVGNMGLHVKELENVGKFDEEQARKLVEICNEYKVYLKGHNADYLLGKNVLTKHPEIGVHSINIAPELGVTETENLFWILHSNNMQEEVLKFEKLAVESGKWKKWLYHKERDVPIRKKAVIAGHYVLAHSDMADMLDKPNVSNYLQYLIKENIAAVMKDLSWDFSE